MTFCSVTFPMYSYCVVLNCGSFHSCDNGNAHATMLRALSRLTGRLPKVCNESL